MLYLLCIRRIDYTSCCYRFKIALRVLKLPSGILIFPFNPVITPFLILISLLIKLSLGQRGCFSHLCITLDILVLNYH
jgi:hypothetical protein